MCEPKRSVPLGAVAAVAAAVVAAPVMGVMAAVAGGVLVAVSVAEVAAAVGLVALVYVRVRPRPVAHPVRAPRMRAPGQAALTRGPAAIQNTIVATPAMIVPRAVEEEARWPSISGDRTPAS